MKHNIIFLIVLFSILSCNRNDDISESDLEIGVNDFVCRIDGKIFKPEDVRKFLNTTHGVRAYWNSGNWYLTFSNSSGRDIHMLIKDVNRPNSYKVGTLDGDLNFFSNTDTTTAIGISNGSGSVNGVAYKSSGDYNNEINIVRVFDDSLITGSFEKIILENPENIDDSIELTEGKFNINLSTLNN